MRKGEIKIVMDLRDLEGMWDWDRHDSFVRAISDFIKEHGYGNLEVKRNKNGLQETWPFVVKDSD